MAEVPGGLGEWRPVWQVRRARRVSPGYFRLARADARCYDNAVGGTEPFPADPVVGGVAQSNYRSITPGRGCDKHDRDGPCAGLRLISQLQGCVRNVPLSPARQARDRLRDELPLFHAFGAQ